MTKLDKKRKSVPDVASGAVEIGLEACSVRIEESKAGGKKLTVIRGLESLDPQQAVTILKGFKSALAVGGRLRPSGEMEIQGAHAELCLVRLQKLGCRDVKLAGAASANPVKAPAWNAPKEIKERAAAAKQAASKAKRSQAKAERAKARSPAAVAAKTLAQLRSSEQQLLAKMRRSDLPKAEKRVTVEKLERTQQRIASRLATGQK